MGQSLKNNVLFFTLPTVGTVGYVQNTQPLNYSQPFQRLEKFMGQSLKNNVLFFTLPTVETAAIFKTHTTIKLQPTVSTVGKIHGSIFEKQCIVLYVANG